MDLYNGILEDLQRLTPINPTVTPPYYNDLDPPERQMESLNRQMRRAKSHKNRIETLLIAWYMGQILEVKADTRGKRSLCLEKLSKHYAKVAVWTYYLFEFLGPEQIVRSRYLRLSMLANQLKEPKYRKLVEESAAIAGARLREEEVVSD